MKTIMVLLALCCTACATSDPAGAENAAYHPPVYRTGSNIPSQGSSGASNTPGPTGEQVRQALPPPIVRNPTGS